MPGKHVPYKEGPCRLPRRAQGGGAGMTWNDIYEFFFCPQHGVLSLAWILGMTSISFLVAYLRGTATTLSKGAATIYAAIRNHLSGPRPR